MADINEQFVKMEQEYEQELATQKRFYESELELLKSKFEYEQGKLKLEYENKITEAKKEVTSYYDVKNVEDIEKQKQYYQTEIESMKNWYEEEIIRRKKETEDWHINNLEIKLTELKNSYEEMIAAKNDIINAKEDMINALEDKLKAETEALSQHIVDQKKYYEEQLKPYKRIVNLKNKIKRKLGINKTSQNSGTNQKVENTEQKTEVQIAGQDNVERPKVSVILPIYNVGKYLRQSLDSLINQTLKEIEIICVNDGSTDDCYEILEEYKAKDNRIKVIHKSNKGTGAARNDGLRIATGECIGFVDPDDWVKPNMYERLYNEIKEKNLDIIMCMPDGYDEMNAKNAPFPYFVDENFKNIIDDRVFNWKDLSPFKYPMCVWNKLYTKELFDKNHIEFAEGLDFEDHKVIFGTLLTAERMYFIREKLYVYRYNREGSVLTDNNRRIIDHIKIFDIVEELMKNTNTFEALRTDFLFYKIHNILYYYSMIKNEFKEEYYEQMVQSIRDTNLTQEEYEMISEKYPELKTIEYSYV